MNRAPKKAKKAKKSRQFFGSTRPQPTSMPPIIFFDTNNQTRICPPHMWAEIYEFIYIEKPSNRPSLIAVQDDDEDFNKINIYDDELVKI